MLEMRAETKLLDVGGNLGLCGSTPKVPITVCDALHLHRLHNCLSSLSVPVLVLDVR